jgi:hypothetical protein
MRAPNEFDTYVAGIIAMYQDPARTPETLAQARTMALGCTSRRLKRALASALVALPRIPPNEVSAGRWYLVARALRIPPDAADELCYVADIDAKEHG